MKCEAGHDMQPIICNSNPRACEWYCGKEGCHQSIYMTGDEIHQMSGGRIVVDNSMAEREAEPSRR